MRVDFDPRARRDLSKLPADLQVRIVRRADALAEDPRPPGSEKPKGPAGPLYRIRVGDYRVAYEIRDRQLLVMAVRVAKRDRVYDNL